MFATTPKLLLLYFQLARESVADLPFFDSSVCEKKYRAFVIHRLRSPFPPDFNVGTDMKASAHGAAKKSIARAITAFVTTCHPNNIEHVGAGGELAIVRRAILFFANTGIIFRSQYRESAREILRMKRLEVKWIGEEI